MENAELISVADDNNAACNELKAEFSALARGALRPTELVANISEICHGNVDATWDALSLIDQYHRRGLLDTEAFIHAKTSLNALVFGSQQDATSSVASADQFFGCGPFPFTKESPLLAENNLTAPGSSPEGLSDLAEQSLTEGAKQPLRGTAVLMDRYVLIDPIHSTATATIFKAFDRQRAPLYDMERFVSVKALNAAVARSPEVQALLNDEFAQSKDLSHPNILATYDYQADGEASFLVQGLLQGQLLSRLIEQHAPRRILRAHALAIVRDIGLALAYAHEKQIVHGALSSETVIIGSSGIVRVFGFGSNGIHQQVISARSGVDISGDVFSLACIAYELLAGHTPFIDVDHQQERRWARIKSLPRKQWLELERGLQPHRSQRPTSVRDWVMELVGEDAATFLPSYDYIASEIPKQRRWLPALGNAAAVILFLGVLAGGAYLAQSGAFKLPMRADSKIAQSLLPPTTTGEPSIAKSNAANENSNSNSNSNSSSGLTASASPPTFAARPQASTTKNAIASDTPTMTVTGSQPKSIASETSESHKPIALPSRANETAIDKDAQNTLDLPARIAFSADRFTVASNESVARVNVVRRGGTTRPVVVKWRTLPGSAKPDTDYAATLDGDVRMAAGETHATIVVPIVHGDAKQQQSKWFDVEITDVSNASLSSATTATVVIIGAEVEQRSASQ